MTPSQLDHLRAIDAHLTALLALAAKRTPGEWLHDGYYVCVKDGEDVAECDLRDDNEDTDNANFIASCAGNAEAGWRSTLAAIEWLQRISEKCDEPTSTYAEQALQEILAAWPIKTLQK